jgi:hypothetical protein
MLDAHEPLFSDIGDDSAVDDERSTAVMANMDTKDVHSYLRDLLD